MKYNLITPNLKAFGLDKYKLRIAMLMCAVDHVDEKDITVTMCEELCDVRSKALMGKHDAK